MQHQTHRVVGMVGRNDSRLRMLQATLGDVRTDAELGEAGTYRPPWVMQRERAHPVLGKGLEVFHEVTLPSSACGLLGYNSYSIWVTRELCVHVWHVFRKRGTEIVIESMRGVGAGIEFRLDQDSQLPPVGRVLALRGRKYLLLL
jgi:hypothetical protein